MLSELICVSAPRIAGPAAMRGCGFGGDDCALCCWSPARRRCRSRAVAKRSRRGGGRWLVSANCRHITPPTQGPPPWASLRSPPALGPTQRGQGIAGKPSPHTRREKGRLWWKGAFGLLRGFGRREELGERLSEDLGRGFGRKAECFSESDFLSCQRFIVKAVRFQTPKAQKLLARYLPFRVRFYSFSGVSVRNRF